MVQGSEAYSQPDVQLERFTKSSHVPGTPAAISTR